jgi:hypothetical protein
MSMQATLEATHQEALAALERATSESDVEAVRVRFLGR